MQLAIYGRKSERADMDFFQKLFDCLKESKHDLKLEKRLFDWLGESGIKLPENVQTFRSYKEIRQCDFMLSLGGDGTLLDTIIYVRDSGIPILGVNFGRLGFLTDVDKEEFSTALKLLEKGEYSLDERSLIQLETNQPLFGELSFSLNDCTIHKKETSSMMTVHVYIDDEYLNSYWVDGLVVATPTGSTAYSLSCGGPIMYPSAGGFIIAPVAPHNLNVRPVVIPETSKITFKLKESTEGDKFLCALDSRSKTIDSSFELQISKAKFKVNLVRLHGSDFSTTLRNKLMWGLDKRN